MKKILIILLVAIISYVIFRIIIFPIQYGNIHPVNAVAGKPDIVIQIPDIRSSQLINSAKISIQGISDDKSFGWGISLLKKIIPWLESNDQYPLVIYNYKEKAEIKQWVFVAGNFNFTGNEMIEFLSGEIKKSKVKQNANWNIYYIPTEYGKIAFSVYKNLFVFSKTDTLVENSLKALETSGNVLSDSVFVALYQTAGKKVDGSVFLRLSELKSLYNGENIFANRLFGMGNAALFDFTVRTNQVIFSGFVISDSTCYPFRLKKQPGNKSELAGFLPNNTVYFETYTTGFLPVFFLNFSVEKTIADNKLAKSENYDNELIDFFYETPVTYAGHFSVSSGQQYFLLRIKNTLQFQKKFNDLYSEYKLRIADSSELFAARCPDMLKGMLFGSKVMVNQPCFIFIYDNYLIATESPSDISRFVQMNKKGKKMMDELANIRFLDQAYASGTYFLFLNNKQLQKSVTNDEKLLLTDFSRISVSCREPLNNFAPVTMVLEMNMNKSAKNSAIPELWNYPAEAPVLNKPRIVKNHIDGSTEIIIYDTLNNLYLFSDNGKLLWKKNINHQISSEITQIDLYKNRKLQYLFIAGNYLYVVDRNGKIVEGYPAQLPVKKAGSLSVVKYAEKSDYRIFIQDDNNAIRLFDINGKPIADWKVFRTSTRLICPIKNFLIDNTDIIAVIDSQKVYLVNRKGKLLWSSKKEIPSPNTDIFYFSTTRKKSLAYSGINATVYLINAKFQTDSVITNSQISSQHYFYCRDIDSRQGDEFFFFDSNMIYISNMQGRILSLGQINEIITTKPQLFQLKENKTVIGVNSVEHNNFYLYDVNGEVLDGFPVQASVPVSIEQDKNNRSRYYIYAIVNSKLTKYQFETE